MGSVITTWGHRGHRFVPILLDVGLFFSGFQQVCVSTWASFFNQICVTSSPFFFRFRPATPQTPNPHTPTNIKSWPRGMCARALNQFAGPLANRRVRSPKLSFWLTGLPNLLPFPLSTSIVSTSSVARVAAYQTPDT